MKRKSIISVAIVTVLLLQSCKNKDAEPSRQHISVEVCTATAYSESSQHRYTGTIEESFNSMLSFQVAGNIQEIFVQENQIVQKGQLLSSIDKSILQNSYDAAYATLLQAEDAFQRMKTLYDNSSLPEMKWIEVQSVLQQAKSMESIAKNNLNNCNLYAPFTAGLLSSL